jgi:hypothetical protein
LPGRTERCRFAHVYPRPGKVLPCFLHGRFEVRIELNPSRSSGCLIVSDKSMQNRRIPHSGSDSFGARSARFQRPPSLPRPTGISPHLNPSDSRLSYRNGTTSDGRGKVTLREQAAGSQSVTFRRKGSVFGIKTGSICCSPMRRGGSLDGRVCEPLPGSPRPTLAVLTTCHPETVYRHSRQTKEPANTTGDNHRRFSQFECPEKVETQRSLLIVPLVRQSREVAKHTRFRL